MFHLAGCCMYAGLPRSYTWWGVQAVCITITTVVGEYLCMHLDLQAIEVNNARMNRKPSLGP